MSYIHLEESDLDRYDYHNGPHDSISIDESINIPTPHLVWNYSSDSDEPSFMPHYPKRPTNMPSFDPHNRNDPAHPLHPQHEQLIRDLSSSVSVEAVPNQPRTPKINERIAARQTVLNNPGLLRRALDLTKKKENMYRNRQGNYQKRKQQRRRYIEAAFGGRSYGYLGYHGGDRYRGSRGRQRRHPQVDDWGQSDDEDDGLGIDFISYTFDRLNGRKATTCLYILSSVVLLAGIIVSAMFFSLSDTAYSFPKLYYTSAVVGALTIVASMVGAIGTWMNHVDVLYGFAALVASLGTVNLILAIMGSLEKDSEIIATLTARQQGALPSALIDLCINNARVMSLTVFCSVLLLYFTCFVLYRLRHALLTDTNPISHLDSHDAVSSRHVTPNQQSNLRHIELGSLHNEGPLSQDKQLSIREIEMQNMQQRQEISLTIPAENSVHV